MKLEVDNFYHLYNRGINRCKIFCSHRNYLFFRDKIKEHVCPHCSLIAYNLMPNHFHMIIHTNANSEKLIVKGGVTANVLSEGIRVMLSSYAQAINKQVGRVGNLFTQNTKSKALIQEPGYTPPTYNNDYLETCFHYVHYNAQKAGLVMSPMDWPYSSFLEYFGNSNFPICDVKLARKNIDLLSYEKLHLPYLLNI